MGTIADIALRAAEARDIPGITAIYAREVSGGTASFELEPPDEAEMERRRQAIVAAGCPYLVAEAGGRVLGYAYAGPYRPRRAYRFTVEDSVYVGSEARGRGVGRLLLAALVEAAAASGFRQMIAVIGDSENRASVGLHAALGFAPAGSLRNVGWKHGRWLDSVLMQRSLGAGDGAPPDPGR
ncbi:MAG TPA: N-acetyltransferase family protein [Bauldia sp.]|nr:N-acetyltransferase family protein [Bauldia sp.]